MLLPGPENAPIDDIFRAPGAAWLMFAFGVTIAPFFEEIVFRGFLLPALATAWDWTMRKEYWQARPRPLDADGHPQWSIFAMVIASIATSLPFALMHAEQTGHSLGSVSPAVCGQPDSLRGAPQNPLVGRQHAGPRLLQLPDLLLHAAWHRRIPASGQDVTTRE